MQFRYQPPYLNKNLNTWFKGIVNARYTSKTVCLSFFCKFIKFAHTIQWGFLQKFLFGHFYVFRELFCLLQHILATVQPKIHLNTKFEILPFGWTKCPKIEPFFLKLPSPHFFRVFYNFLTVRRGCLHPQHIFPSFSSLFLLLSSLSFFSFLPFLFLSLQIFGAATAAILHCFRRACN